MSDYKPYVDDEGTAIEIDMQEDLTSWDNLKFYIKKPGLDKNVEEKIVTATVKGIGDDAKIMQYIIGAGSGEGIVNFDAPGIYYFQPYGEVLNWKGKGDTISFVVSAKYQ